MSICEQGWFSSATIVFFLSKDVFSHAKFFLSVSRSLSLSLRPFLSSPFQFSTLALSLPLFLRNLHSNEEANYVYKRWGRGRKRARAHGLVKMAAYGGQNWTPLAHPWRYFIQERGHIWRIKPSECLRSEEAIYSSIAFDVGHAHS